MVGKKKSAKTDGANGGQITPEAANKQKQNKKSQNKSGPNTGPIYYLSNKKVAAACEDETDQVVKACDEDKAASKKQAEKSSAINPKLGKATAKVKKGLVAVEAEVKDIYNYKRHDNNAWIEDHCNGLWIKPMAGKEGFDKFTTSLSDLKKKLEKDINEGLTNAGKQVGEVAKKKAGDYVEKAVVREGAALASLVVPAVGEVIVIGATIWNVVDGVWTAGSIAVQAVGAGKAALAKYMELKPQLKALERLLSDGADKITPSTVLAEMMTAAAGANPCIQARRCILVPYEETEASSVGGAGAAQASSGKGCCPGQTGHHVLPEAMFNVGDGNACSNKYEHSKALVICAEGTGNRVGSHGVAHLALDELIERYKESGAETISYKEARGRGIAAARELNSACSKDCMKAQLDAHYKDKLGCEDAKLTPHSGMGGAPSGAPAKKVEATSGEPKKKPKKKL